MKRGGGGEDEEERLFRRKEHEAPPPPPHRRAVQEECVDGHATHNESLECRPQGRGYGSGGEDDDATAEGRTGITGAACAEGAEDIVRRDMAVIRTSKLNEERMDVYIEQLRDAIEKKDIVTLQRTLEVLDTMKVTDRCKMKMAEGARARDDGEAAAEGNGKKKKKM